MGLDTTHDAWHGAYSAFSRWRDALARAAGYELVKIADNPGYPAYMEFALADWGHVEQKNYEGDWDYVPCGLRGSDPLLFLIFHSDCDGYIEPDHCALIADRLAELLPALADLPDGGGHLGNVHAKTEQFIKGCRAAAEAGERVEFA